MLQFRFTPVGLFLRLCKCALRSSIFRMVSMCILKLGELTYVAIQGIKRLFGTVAGPVQLPNYFFLCEAFGRQFFVHRIAHLTHGGRLQADPCRGSPCPDHYAADPFRPFLAPPNLVFDALHHTVDPLELLDSLLQLGVVGELVMVWGW